ncbi:phosphoenolpyruvate carboxylase, partial [Serratia marcescens]|uniref:phosphoenolpyruvate carboxylase n=1 Tax=Serratia marcescens TaxID=615 RepID=UPI001954E8C2
TLRSSVALAMGSVFKKFNDKNISTEKLFQQICDLKIELVLTAHPTEVSRRTLIQKYDDILE